MQNVILVIHLLACLALIASVLLQRSEGGALGMGGGGGGMISGRGAANVLVRVTMVLAAVFFATSLTLTTLNSLSARAPSDVERVLEEGDLPTLPGDVGAAPEASPGPSAPSGANDDIIEGGDPTSPQQ
ncbi:MAG: preprotein translocase subunit SecG [Pseudomonadota bacterium]